MADFPSKSSWDLWLESRQKEKRIETKTSDLVVNIRDCSTCACCSWDTILENEYGRYIKKRLYFCHRVYKDDVHKVIYIKSPVKDCDHYLQR